jgi:hypothetical protein
MSSNWEKRKNAKKFATDAECGITVQSEKIVVNGKNCGVMAASLIVFIWCTAFRLDATFATIVIINKKRKGRGERF